MTSHNQPKILAFAGSSRKESFNKKLLMVAIQGAKEHGADVTFVDLKDYDFPLYNGDFEEEHGIPQNVLELKAIFKEHQGLLIASPEYNSSFTPLLKNTIDWVSRPSGDEGMLECYKGKFASILSTSPGGLGGLRCLFHLREVLQNIFVTVLPNQLAVPNAMDVFDEQGRIKDKNLESKVKAVGADLAEFLKKMN